MTDIRLFGQMQINGTDASDLLSTEKARALLAYLCLLPQRAARRVQLAALFWPDLARPRALHNLTMSLAIIRRLTLDGTPSPVEETGTLIRLRDHVTTDVQSFEQLYQTVVKHPHRTTDGCPSCVHLARRALTVAHAPLLIALEVPDSEEFNDWLHATQERVREQTIALQRRIAAFLDLQQKFGEARLIWKAVLTQEPWLEDVHRALMRNYVNTDERSSALRQYARCREALRRHLQAEPDHQTVTLYEQILNAQGPPPTHPRRPTHALPFHPTPCFPRDDVLQPLLARLYSRTTRLVSLCGIGGSGKSYLSLTAAHELAASFADGVHFVRLETSADSQSAAVALAQQLRIEVQPQPSPVEQIAQQLSARACLVILDNCEQLEDPATLLNALSSRCPDVVTLVTTRRALGAASEEVIELGGFPLAASADTERTTATAFFQARLAQVAPHRRLQQSELAAVNRICELVGGLPLALEIAAHLARETEFEPLVELLTAEPDRVATSLVDLPHRHRGLAAILTATWRVLDPEISTALSLLTVCRTPFDSETAAIVLGDKGLALRTLHQATTYALLPGSTDGLLQLHPLVRTFLTNQRSRAVEATAAAEHRHMQHFLSLLDTAQLAFPDFGSITTAEHLRDRAADIRVAWLHAIATRQAPLLARLYRAFTNYLSINGWFTDIAGLLNAAVTAFDTNDAAAQETTVQLLITAARHEVHCGRYSDAEQLIERVPTDAHHGVLNAQLAGIRATIAYEQGDAPGAEVHFLEALAHAATLPPDVYVPISYHYCRLLLARNDLVVAAELLRNCIAAARDIREMRTLVYAENMLATIPGRSGDFEASIPLLEAALTDARRLQLRSTLTVAVINLAYARAMAGRPVATVNPLCLEAEELVRNDGRLPQRTAALHSLASAYLAAGNLASAERLLSEGAGLALRLNNLRLQLPYLEAFGSLLARQGRLAEAAAALSTVLHHPQATAYLRSCAERTATTFALTTDDPRHSPSNDPAVLLAELSRAPAH